MAQVPLACTCWLVHVPAGWTCPVQLDTSSWSRIHRITQFDHWIQCHVTLLTDSVWLTCMPTEQCDMVYEGLRPSKTYSKLQNACGAPPSPRVYSSLFSNLHYCPKAVALLAKGLSMELPVKGVTRLRTRIGFFFGKNSKLSVRDASLRKLIQVIAGN